MIGVETATIAASIAVMKDMVPGTTLTDITASIATVTTVAARSIMGGTTATTMLTMKGRDITAKIAVNSQTIGDGSITDLVNTATTAGSIADATVTISLIAAAGDITVANMVITPLDAIMDIAGTSTLVAAVEVMTGAMATGIMQVGGIMGTAAASLLIAAAGGTVAIAMAITALDDIMDTADTSSLAMADEVTRGAMAMDIVQPGGITGTEATSLLIAADITTVITGQECIIATTVTSSLTGEDGDTPVTWNITTHTTLLNGIMVIGGTGWPTTAAGDAAPAAWATPLAGATRDRETKSITLGLTVRKAMTRKTAIRRMATQRTMVSRPQALDRVALGLRSRRECLSTATRTKMAS